MLIQTQLITDSVIERRQLMSQPNQYSHGKEHHHEHGAPRKKIHHDWRFWAIVLMLAAIVIYVVTMDESLEPGGPVQQAVPADAE
jgi:hypothetical protein